MEETSTVTSYYFKKKFAIHGRNVHLPASMKTKHTWFVSHVWEDTACTLVGSTTDVCRRWASTKKACLDRDSTNTGLYKHFKNGCPADKGDGDLAYVKWTLVDFVETSAEKLVNAGHLGGAKCRCTECHKLKANDDN